MNFTQMQEKLRLELLRRINRGTLSVSLLARQTGFNQAHLSNFLNNRRQLSLPALDRVMSAQHLALDDLMAVVPRASNGIAEGGRSEVPILSMAASLFDPYIRPAVARAMLQLPDGLLETLRTPASKARREWQRFVAVRVSEADARPMEPLLWPQAIALIDRHYVSLSQYHPDRANIYAVLLGSHIRFRHVDLTANRLVLRPYSRAFPVELEELEPNTAPRDVIAGRVVMVMNEV